MERMEFKDFQNLLMQSFDKINNSFLENGIFWWANSGTLLGAIRDKGLIYWDDDIDMSMFNIDFFDNKEKIESILEEMNWELADASKNWGQDVMRFFSKDKIIVEYEGEEYITKPYIDIMISVPTRRQSKIRSGWWSIANKYSWIYGDFYNILPKQGWIKGKRVKIGFFRNFGVFFSKVITFPFMFWVPVYQNRKLRKVKRKANHYQAFYCFDNRGLHYYYKDKKNNFLEKPFGNSLINVPKTFESELETWYGKNWNSLPSEDKRVPHNLLLTPNNGTKYKINPFLIK